MKSIKQIIKQEQPELDVSEMIKCFWCGTLRKREDITYINKLDCLIGHLWKYHECSMGNCQWNNIVKYCDTCVGEGCVRRIDKQKRTDGFNW